MSNTKVAANNHESYTALSLLTVVFPLVGFIVGIVYLTKDRPVDRKLGEHLIVIAQSPGSLLLLPVRR